MSYHNSGKNQDPLLWVQLLSIFGGAGFLFIGMIVEHFFETNALLMLGYIIIGFYWFSCIYVLIHVNIKNKKLSTVICCFLYAAMLIGFFVIVNQGRVHKDSDNYQITADDEYRSFEPSDKAESNSNATKPRFGILKSRTVYVSTNGHKIHLKSDCSGMKHYTKMTYQEACDAGYSHCSKCF